MGRKLSDAERGARLVGSIEVRALGAKGKCKLCKTAIEKGQKSLRYNEVVYGRKQECGMCMDCASRLWQHAENAVGLVSAAIQEHMDQDPGSATASPEDELVMARPQQPTVPQTSDPQPPQYYAHNAVENLVMSSEAIPDVARQDMEDLRRNRERMLAEMGLGKNHENNS